VHPIKGVDILLDAWSLVRPPGWRLVIAGPDETGMVAALEHLVRESGLRDVEFRGALPNAEKWRLLEQAQLFVLPSRGESFGMAIAEALASGVAVLTTTEAPWQSIETFGCGWRVRPEVGPVADALRMATTLSREELEATGRRGRMLAETLPNWDDVGGQMRQLYQWVLCGGAPPDFVDAA
jgi:glycosyltransferase involved in cell wall biosynthesis